MKKAIFLLTVSSLLLISCSQKTSLSGAGATFPLPYYNLVFKAFTENAGIDVSYGGIGSGGGIRSLKDEVVDFAGSDAYLSDEEMAEMKATIHVPTCLGAVVLSYNLPDVSSLNLTGDIIAGIYLGKITRWNDATITNGEGYKKLNTDKYFRYGGGLSITPIKELIFRIYYDRHDKNPDNLTHEKSKQIASIFAGYQNEAFSLGGEYLRMFHPQFREDRNQHGYSAYTTIKLPKDFQLFGRWDYAVSNKDYDNPSDVWNPGDQQMAILGVQYAPVKGVKLAPNFRMVAPKNDDALYYITVNLSLSL